MVNKISIVDVLYSRVGQVELCRNYFLPVMSLIERSTTVSAFVDAQTPTRILRIRVLGLTIYRRELIQRGQMAVSYLLGLPVYQADVTDAAMWG